jgi:hypothetical protein
MAPGPWQEREPLIFDAPNLRSTKLASALTRSQFLKFPALSNQIVIPVVKLPARQPEPVAANPISLVFLLEFLVGLDVVFQRRSIERSVSAHQRLGEAEV